MKTALITGAAGGLGRALIDGLLNEGDWRIIATDLPGPGLEALEGRTGVETVACDITDEADLDRACTQITATHPALDLVIYNAGITQISEAGELSSPAHRKVFAVNYFGATDMAQRLLAPVRAAGGTHLAISSVAGFAPLYHRAAYAASKHALDGFFKTLRAEEKARAVDVLIAAPSFVATNQGNAQKQSDGIARPGGATDGVDYMTAEIAAITILRGYHRRKALIPVGRVARLSWIINRLSPRLFERIMLRNIADK